MASSRDALARVTAVAPCHVCSVAGSFSTPNNIVPVHTNTHTHRPQVPPNFWQPARLSRAGQPHLHGAVQGAVWPRVQAVVWPQALDCGVRPRPRQVSTSSSRAHRLHGWRGAAVGCGGGLDVERLSLSCDCKQLMLIVAVVVSGAVAAAGVSTTGCSTGQRAWVTPSSAVT